MLFQVVTVVFRQFEARNAPPSIIQYHIARARDVLDYLLVYNINQRQCYLLRTIRVRQRPGTSSSMSFLAVLVRSTDGGGVDSILWNCLMWTLRACNLICSFFC